MNKDVVIETERLILRQWTMNDIDDICKRCKSRIV